MTEVNIVKVATDDEISNLKTLLVGVQDWIHNRPEIQKAYNKYALGRLDLPETTTLGGREGDSDIPESDVRYEIYWVLTNEWFAKFYAGLMNLQFNPGK